MFTKKQKKASRGHQNAKAAVAAFIDKNYMKGRWNTKDSQTTFRLFGNLFFARPGKSRVNIRNLNQAK